MAGGEEVLNALKKDRPGGLPWMVILDGEGQELITSVGPEGNIGCPARPHEIDYFVEMIEQTSETSAEGLAEIRAALEANAKKLKIN